MSSFLVVVPPGWVEIENGDYVINSSWGPDGIVAIIATGAWYEVTQSLEEKGLLPVGKICIGAQFIQTEDAPDISMRFWCLFTDEFPP